MNNPDLATKEEKYFHPWIGKNWANKNNPLKGNRLLVLGESHYCDNPELVGKCEPEVTSEVVEDLAINNNHRFFSNITQVISGRKKYELTHVEIEELWNSLMFYNYVPVYAADGPRQSPTKEMFELGAKPFSRLMEFHKPEAILVVGFRLWWWLLTGWSEFKGDPTNHQTYRIGSALAAKMMHASAPAFSSELWHPKFVKLIENCNQL